MTVKQLHNQWGETDKFRKLCISTRMATNAIVLRLHGECEVGSVTAADICAWLNGSGAATTDVMSAYSAVSNMMRWAEENGLWSGIPGDIRVDTTVLSRAPEALPVNNNTEKRDTKPSRAASERRVDRPTLGSGKFRDAGIGRILDRKGKQPGRPMPPGCAPMTEKQHNVRLSAVRSGYRPGSLDDPNERMIVYVLPRTQRRPLIEERIVAQGFRLMTLDRRPVEPMARFVPFTRAESSTRRSATNRGYTFGHMHDAAERKRVYVGGGTQRCKRTETALLGYGYEIIVR